MEEIKLYVLHSAPILGLILPSSQVEQKIICNQCNIVQLPRVYKNIDLEIDSWNGEDIFQAQSVFFVSERLKDLMETNQIKGCSFKKVQIIKSTYFFSSLLADDQQIPVYWELVIEGRCKGPEIWWKRVTCQDCEKTKWSITPSGIISISVPFNTDPVPPRKVFVNSWNGDDIFYLEDPDVPIVTEKLMAVFNQLKCEFIALESGWEI